MQSTGRILKLPGDGPDPALAPEVGLEAIEHIGRDHGVAVQQQHELARGARDGLVVGARETVVAAVADDDRPGEGGRDPFEGVVAAAVVHQVHFVAGFVPGPGQGGQGIEQHFRPVSVYNHNRKSFFHLSFQAG